MKHCSQKGKKEGLSMVSGGRNSNSNKPICLVFIGAIVNVADIKSVDNNITGHLRTTD